MTAAEAREAFLRLIAERVKYWAEKPDATPQARCVGVASEILCMIDGTTDLPAIDLFMPTAGLLNFQPLHPVWSALLTGRPMPRCVDGTALYGDRLR